MTEIQVGDRVKFRANPDVNGYLYEPTDNSKNLNPVTVEDLVDQFGTVIETGLNLDDDQVVVKLNDGPKVIAKKQYLTKVLS